MIVLYAQASLRAPWCHSLKEKRSLIKPLMIRLRTVFNASVVETGMQNSHQLLEVGMTALAFDSAQADSMAEQWYAFILENTEAELYDWQVAYR